MIFDLAISAHNPHDIESYGVACEMLRTFRKANPISPIPQ